MLEHDHLARRVGQALLDLWLLEESSHRVHLSYNRVDVSVASEFIQQLLLVFDILLGASELELLNYITFT